MDSRSERNLIGVHGDLVTLIRAVDTSFPHEIIVTEGVRTFERQAQLYAAKASQTMNSRHLTGHAVDLAVKIGGQVVWTWHIYAELGAFVKAKAKELGIPIQWGGDWARLKDGPHFELPRNAYFEERIAA